MIALRGRDACPPAARDHKPLGVGDEGRNTGGLGHYSPLAEVPDDSSPISPGLPSASPRERLDAGWLFAAPVRRLNPHPRPGAVLLVFNARLGDRDAGHPAAPACPLAALLLARRRWPPARRRGGLGVIGDVLPAEPGAAVAIVLPPENTAGAARRAHRRAGRSDARRASLPCRDEAGRGRRLETDGGRILAVVGGDGLPRRAQRPGSRPPGELRRRATTHDSGRAVALSSRCRLDGADRRGVEALP